ncbi:MAG: moleuclar chaperone Hap20 [Nitrospirae bacterium RBG_13_39_12]|nr:MAG: moleuclar chaperone Hap20 [Nitrospirae bacterium RBG_13_39_12]
MAGEKTKGTKVATKTEPSRALTSFHEMERWFEDFLRSPFSPSRWRRLRTPDLEEVSPSIDIFTEKDNVIVKAELPGIKKEDIDVSITDHTMRISGEKKREEKTEKKDYYWEERSYGSFVRSFQLPAEVQTDKASAKFKDGVLEITIPKTEEAKKKEKKVAVE